jgi:NAD+ diphosphatase
MTGRTRSDAEELEFVHTFAGGTLDRVAHLRADDGQIQTMLTAPGSRFLPFLRLDPLVREGLTPSLGWLLRAGVADLVDVGKESLLLGLEGGAARFAVPLPETRAEDSASFEGASFRNVREVAPLLTGAEASTVALGRSLVSWNASHRHCPRCGGPTEMTEAGYSRLCSDAACGTRQFPRTDPVVIMLIHRDGRCLLGRAVRARRYPPGLHSCLAGYVEPGESIEEAVRRETWEEAGLRIDRVRYHSSQPWPFPSTLMIGCFAHALPGEARIDPTEVESVRWFTREELARAVERWDVDGALRMPPPLTIAHQLARAWLAESPCPILYAEEREEPEAG